MRYLEFLLILEFLIVNAANLYSFSYLYQAKDVYFGYYSLIEWIWTLSHYNADMMILKYGLDWGFIVKPDGTALIYDNIIA